MSRLPLRRILVTGATGQIGSELTPALRARYGAENVVAAGHRREPGPQLAAAGPYETLDVRDRQAVAGIIAHHRIDTVFHLAAILSASAEAKPAEAWTVNMDGLINLLEAARDLGCAVFHPSSIGAFGPDTPRFQTPQVTVQRPTTIYGITKVSGELLCDYYHRRFGVDTRGVRYPGIVSAETMPGGGTTDYAVEIFFAAVREGEYTCFLGPDTRLDLISMPDAVRAAIELMESDPARLRHRNAYNLSAMSLTPAELASAIRRRLPGFRINYRVDPLRQAIADSWPERLDDAAARTDWGWRPEDDLERMVDYMLKRVCAKTDHPRCPDRF